MSTARLVLVTGGNGFIGRHLVRALVDQGHAVTLLQRSERAVSGTAGMIVLEQLMPEGIRTALHGRRFDWVIHLAAYGVDPAARDIEPMFRLNVDVTRTLTELAAGWPARAMFVAGSGAEYALAGIERPVPEEHPLELFKSYGASKAAGTACALALATALQLPLVVGRIFGVYGPGEAQHRLLPSLFRGLRNGRRVALTEGAQTRDFLYVADVAEAIIMVLAALERTPRQAILNISTGQPFAIRTFAEAVAQELEAPRELLGFGDMPMRPDETGYFSGDSRRILAFAGWRPRHDLTTGIAKAIRLLRQETEA